MYRYHERRQNPHRLPAPPQRNRPLSSATKTTGPTYSASTTLNSAVSSYSKNTGAHPVSLTRETLYVLVSETCDVSLSRSK
ncbi:hypothetical protein EJ03DRAFT_81258 [Teratosphaeria nubilosa]|uniref:Uncharacterized protein n=1 Tax=Teratosphaeria nubilosa TaxID=161662 RepID=A0A6G1LBD1_9PEZI|nr:hypothetical protein EJ03DRAFT_81258 [Teratosphaeria nubilosa]